MTKLRLYDTVSASRVDHFIAGSQNAKKRIAKVYRKKAKVVYPFVDLDKFKNIETFDGRYFVIIGRPNKYKRFDLAINACREIGVELKIIEGDLSDRMVINILAGSKALIIPGEEDFGLTSLEAQALGKPVIAYREGGALETVNEGKTGVLFEDQTADCLKDALVRLDSLRIDPDDCRRNAIQFSKEHFIDNFKTAVASLVYT